MNSIIRHLVIAVFCASVLALASPGSARAESGAMISSDHLADMSQYTALDDLYPAFVKISLTESLDFLKNGKTGILVYTAPWCPYCQYAIPVLNEALEEAGIIALLIDPSEYDRNTEAEAFHELSDLFRAVWGTHEDDTVINVPEVIAVKNGTIAGHHYELLDTFAKEEVSAGAEMSAEQREELKEIYAGLISLIME